MYFVLSEYDVIRKSLEVPKRRVSSKTTCSLDPSAPPIPPKPVSAHGLVQHDCTKSTYVCTLDYTHINMCT